MRHTVRFAVCLLLAACSVEDSDLANEAPARFIGLSELDLESCIGAPHQRDRFGSTDILTYETRPSSSSGLGLTLPLIGGVSFSGSGGFCRVIVRIESGRVREVRYTGDTGPLYAPEAHCAPLVRQCVRSLRPPETQETAAR